jgi:hypothetical protein
LEKPKPITEIPKPTKTATDHGLKNRNRPTLKKSLNSPYRAKNRKKICSQALELFLGGNELLKKVKENAKY